MNHALSVTGWALVLALLLVIYVITGVAKTKFRERASVSVRDADARPMGLTSGKGIFIINNGVTVNEDRSIRVPVSIKLGTIEREWTRDKMHISNASGSEHSPRYVPQRRG